MNSRLCCALLCLASLSSCAQNSTNKDAEIPMPYHDTRLQYAILTADEEVLSRDFKMKPPHPLIEQVLAGLLLPFTAATDTVFLPFAYGIKTFAPARQQGPSAQ